MAAPLILALLARVPFAGGLLLHDHCDLGVHSHTVTLDERREGGLHAAWHRHDGDVHDDDRDDRNNDSDSGEYSDPLFIFVNDAATTMGIHCSPGTVTASIQHPSSRTLPRSILPSDRTCVSRFLTAPRPSAHPLRPAFVLDALLQSSHALLL